MQKLLNTIESRWRRAADGENKRKLQNVWISLQNMYDDDIKNKYLLKRK